MFGLALATTVAVVGWGYLVYAAVDFGSDARDGERRAWIFLALAAIGAAACLFAALLLGARTVTALGNAPGRRPGAGQGASPGHDGASVSPGSAGSGRPTGSHQKDR